MEGQIELKLKAKHFIDTNYSDKCNCAISKAAKEQFKTENVNENVYEMEIDNKIYFHEYYFPDDFLLDSVLAKNELNKQTVIRIINLKPKLKPKLKPNEEA